MLDHLFANYTYQKPEDWIGENGWLMQLAKAFLEVALQAELAVYLAQEKHWAIAIKSGKTRKGKTGKTIKGEFGKMPIDVPRDRDRSFALVVTPKAKPILSQGKGKLLKITGITDRFLNFPLAITLQ